ncbi:hypothetical protein H6G04_29545 [Calothrix membranacea FACHB-236]|nr:hypothetical protein [Calothrix membranacea FACHB-236]
MAQTSLSITDYSAIIQTITNIIQAIAVIISLLYLARQVRDNTRATKSATYHSIINAFATLEALITQEEELANIYQNGLNNIEQLNKNQLNRFNKIIASYFNLYESLYYQYKNHILDEELWMGWCRYMHSQLEAPGIYRWWQSKSHLFNKSFRDYVNLGKCPRE